MKLQQYKNKVKRLITGHEAGLSFFSQGGEDAILRSIFRKKLLAGEKGFYIDIGAYHPSDMSNTYFFYISGWRGINIDARPGSMKAFEMIRPEDINLEIGIGGKEEILTYYLIDERSTMNSFSKEFLVNTGMYNQVKQEIAIQVYPLKNILDKYSGEFIKIDILNIDAEGLDMQIIESNDWKRFRPSVITIEMNCSTLNDVLENDAAKYIAALGYNIVAKNVVVKEVATVIFADKNFDY